ncbi:PTS sugar transporter subunit IIB [Subtercola sp. RTI3]|uniref:PTS sugar transporter subunit IIB n=1 Tax=Subtercola sp. RTI3 TaxID=3048639 RepID=UPI002B22DC48|nr:PTS sugar transporter subunit IIB [Subtercola sp. RTI3]MEA9984543.1 PTS sugar transporter subunit IIB [Subtercola sp. RTI3]
MKNILVVCGAGASSTFLAHSMRKAATSRHLEVTITAASQDALVSSLAGIHALLVGPHLAADFEALRDTAALHGVRAALLPETVFSAGGQNSALDLAVSLLLPAPASFAPAPSTFKEQS